MQNQELWQLLEETGVYTTGHFQLSSGRHSGEYLQCARLLQWPDKTELVARAMADRLAGLCPDTVIGPALGGIIIAYELARALEARAIFAERAADNQMALRRGFTLRPGEKVLVVEDVVTTGGSVRELLDLLGGQEVEVVGVTSIIDRSDGEVDFGVPFFPLITMPVRSYPPQECPLCQAGLPVTKPGSRK